MGDSVLIKDKKISKVIPLEDGRQAIVLSGKHKGRKGEIKNVQRGMVILESNGEKINILKKDLMAVK